MKRNEITLYGKGVFGTNVWKIWSEENIIHIMANGQRYNEVITEGKQSRTIEDQVKLRIEARVRNKMDGGFKKSILANVPAHFTTGAVIANQGGDTGQVVSIYQPYTPIVSELKNNEINTNTIGIKIVDMLDEKPAVHLTRSIVNFTIHDGEN